MTAIFLDCQVITILIQTNGNKLTIISVPPVGCTFRWLLDFLSGKSEVPDTWAIDGITYKAHYSSGNFYLKETRGGQHTGTVGFTPEEIPAIIEALK